MQIRLDKFISSQTSCTRSEIKKLIKDKSVLVNGQAVTAPDLKIDPASDHITLSGREIIYQEHLYLMMNKPAGVISATEDNRQKTVLDLLPEEYRRKDLFPAGRLDKDTVGLLIITDDGELAHRMLSPKKHVEKYYTAVLDREPAASVTELFREGIILSDGTCCKEADILSIDGDTVSLRITEGKYHQVKRMFKSAGYTVIFLKRTRIGALTLDGRLSPGEVRPLSKAEVEKLLQNETNP